MKTLIECWLDRDPQATEELAALVYDNLRRLAASYMRSERADHTLSPTALVHEAYVRLSEGRLSIKDRPHFIAMAAREMRRVLVDNARRRSAGKRGGKLWQRVTLHEAHQVTTAGPVDMLDLQAVLDKLEEVDKRKAQLVDLLCFGGLTVDEAAAVLDVSTATIGREWRMVRAWLQHELRSAETLRAAPKN